MAAGLVPAKPGGTGTALEDVKEDGLPKGGVRSFS